MRLFLALAIALGAWCSARAESKIDVHCPAVGYDDHDRDRSVPGGPGKVAFIAIGKIQKSRSGNKEGTELVADQVLFGPMWSVVPLVNVPLPKVPGRRIYCLSYGRHESEFQLTINNHYDDVRIFSIDEHAALSAMAQAHTDQLVLHSKSIFVGRPVAPVEPRKTKTIEPNRAGRSTVSRDEQKPIAITVDRVLYGTFPKEGESILVANRTNPLPPGDAYLYFVHNIPDDENVPDDEPGEARPVISAYRWPASEAPQVEATLKRRTLFPIHESDGPYGRNTTWREITFQGTRTEAISLLRSRFDSARILAARRLITDREAALGDVTAVVEANLFRTALDSSNWFTHQNDLIRLLGILEGHRTDGQVVRLVRQILDKVQGGASFPAETKRREDKPPRAHHYDSLDPAFNHSLAWLLLTLDERDVARLFGERLLKLRDLSAYGWKDEIQYVVDNRHIEDHLEVAALQARMAKINILPARWQAGFRFHESSPYAVTISHDSRYLAVAGGEAGRVWDTSDWSIAGEFVQSGRDNDIAFSPDGRFLYVAGRGALEKWDWQAGKCVQTYSGDDGPDIKLLRLSPDGTRILSYGKTYRRQSIVIWETESGKIVQRSDGNNWDSLEWHPEGHSFLGRCFNQGWSRVDLDRNRKEPIDIDFIVAVFSKDGKSLYCLEHPPKEKGRDADDNDSSPTPFSFFGPPKPKVKPILCRRAVPGFAVEAERRLDYSAEHLQVSGNGKQVAVCASHEIEVFVLPDLQSQVRSKLAIDSNRSFAISPDMRWLIATSEYESPKLFDVRTGRRLPLGPAHSGPVVRLKFGENDARLVSEGADGVTCVWDASTRKLVERIGEPAEPTYDSPDVDAIMRHPSEDRTVEYTFETDSVRYAYGPATSYAVYTVPLGRKGETANKDSANETDEDDDGDDADPSRNGRCKLGTIELQWGQHKPLGLVPDGEHFFVGTHIFKRDNLTLVSRANVSGEIVIIAYSLDASRYAMVTVDSIREPTIFGQERHTGVRVHQIRVHESKTGRTVFCTEVPDPGVRCVALSHSGRKLAAVGYDNEIQVWSISDPDDHRTSP